MLVPLRTARRRRRDVPPRSMSVEAVNKSHRLSDALVFGARVRRHPQPESSPEARFGEASPASLSASPGMDVAPSGAPPAPVVPAVTLPASLLLEPSSTAAVPPLPDAPPSGEASSGPPPSAPVPTPRMGVHSPAWHSPPTQRVRSGCGLKEQAPVAGLHMPGSSHSPGGAQTTVLLGALHEPAWQVSPDVHAFASSQGVLSGAGALVHNRVTVSQVPATWH